MVTGGFEWLLVVKGGYWVVRGGYEWSHVVSGGFVVVGGNGWLKGGKGCFGAVASGW